MSSWEILVSDLFRSSTASSQFWPTCSWKTWLFPTVPHILQDCVGAKDGRSTMLPTWTAEQASHGSAMVPVAQYRQATRTSSPTRDRAKAPGPPGGPPGMTGGTLPQGVPMAPMAAPGMPNVSGVPVMPMALWWYSEWRVLLLFKEALALIADTSRIWCQWKSGEILGAAPCVMVAKWNEAMRNQRGLKWLQSDPIFSVSVCKTWCIHC